MELEMQLKDLLQLEDPGPRFTQRVLLELRRTRTRTRRRPAGIILAGVILAAAAAAAVLTLSPKKAQPLEAADSIRVPPAFTAPDPVMEPVELPTSDPGTGEGVNHATVTPGKSEAPPPVKTFTVALLPVGPDISDQALRSATESVHRELTLKLRANPAVVLKEEAPAEFTLLLRDPGTGNPFGPFAQPESTPSRRSGTRSPADRHTILLHVSIADSPARPEFQIRSTVTLPGECTAAANTDAARRSCVGPAEVAGRMIDELRSSVFPPDPSLARELRAQLGDPRRDPSARLDALARLNRLILDGRAPSWEPSDFQIAMDLASAANGDNRRSTLELMRGIRHPGVIQPLIALMHDDADYSLRIEAAKILGGNFSGDAAARSALETAATTDSRLLVRQVAKRVLAGQSMMSQEDWRPLVIAALDDQSLSVAERIDPLVYVSGTPLTSGSSRSGVSFGGAVSVASDDIAQSASRMISALTAEQRNLEETSTLLRLLGQSTHPAVREAMMQLVRNPANDAATAAAAAYFFREYCSSAEMRQLLEEAADRNAHLRTNMTITCSQ